MLLQSQSGFICLTPIMDQHIRVSNTQTTTEFRVKSRAQTAPHRRRAPLRRRYTAFTQNQG